MKKMTRAELDAMKGVKPAPAAAPATEMKAMQDVVAALAGQMQQTNAMLAKQCEQQAQSKKMKATIHRDKSGKMAEVTIEIIQG